MQTVASMEIYVRCYERKQKNLKHNNAQIQCFDSFEGLLFSLDVHLHTENFFYDAVMDDKKRQDLEWEANKIVQQKVDREFGYQMSNPVDCRVHFCKDASDFFATKKQRYGERKGGAGAAHRQADPDLQNESTPHERDAEGFAIPHARQPTREDPMKFHNPAYNPYFVSF